VSPGLVEVALHCSDESTTLPFEGGQASGGKRQKER